MSSANWWLYYLSLHVIKQIHHVESENLLHGNLSFVFHNFNLICYLKIYIRIHLSEYKNMAIIQPTSGYYFT